MISISDILSLFKVFNPGIIINCSIEETSRLGEYKFIIKNLSNRKVLVNKILVNDLLFPERFSVSEQNKKFPILFLPLQEMKYTLFLTRENHYELPKTCKISFKYLFLIRQINQVL
jgi:hypothetical protein